MAHDIRQAILAYFRSVGGPITYADLVSHVGARLTQEEASTGLVEALLTLVNEGMIEAGTYFRMKAQGYPEIFTLALAPLAPVFAAYGEWVTAAQMAAHTELAAEEASRLVHNLWWNGVLERDYRYAIASSPQASPQESIQSDDTTPPPPAA